MTTCALLAKHPHIVAGVCLMGSPAPLEYGKEIVRRASEYNYVVPKDYFDLISWVKSYDLSLQPEKLAGRPLFFWHGQADEKIPYIQTERFVEKIGISLTEKKLFFVPQKHSDIWYKYH